MKYKNAVYFSVFFFVCFLASFTVRTYQNYTAHYPKVDILASKHFSLSTEEDGSYVKAEFVFEENENENEFDSLKKNLSIDNYFTFHAPFKNYICYTSGKKTTYTNFLSSYRFPSNLYIVFRTFRI